MNRKRAWRYYCDFCKKGGASGSHMKRHEGSCCKNPDRVCRMCAAAKLGPHRMQEMIAALGKGNKQGIDALRQVAEGCPACMLAAIMQSGIQRPYLGEDEPGFRVEFDFKAEKDAWWKEQNSLRFERETPWR